MDPHQPSISVLIVTHNHLARIRACLNSLQQEKITEIIVVDHESSDGTLDVVTTFPKVRLISQSNRGFGGGCNRAAAEAKGEFLVFLNPDTVVETDAIKALCEPLRTPQQITTAQLVLAERPDRINALGLDLHFTGLGFVRALDNPAFHAKPFPVPGFSGAAFAIRGNDFRALGGFDERIFLYGEDVELSWRARSLGFQILAVPEARVRHSYRLALTPDKLYHLERSRQILVRSYFSGLRRIAYALSLAATAFFISSFARTLGREGREALVKARRDAKLAPTIRRRNRMHHFARRTLPYLKGFTTYHSFRIMATFPNLIFVLNTVFWWRRPDRWLRAGR